MRALTLKLLKAYEYKTGINRHHILTNNPLYLEFSKIGESGEYTKYMLLGKLKFG